MRLTAALILILALLTIASFGCAVRSIEERSGYFLTYEVDLSSVAPENREMAMNQLVEDVARRLISLGVDDPIIAIEGSNRFNAQIYGYKELEKANSAIAQAADKLTVPLRQVYQKAITPSE